MFTSDSPTPLQVLTKAAPPPRLLRCTCFGALAFRELFHQSILTQLTERHQYNGVASWQVHEYEN
jgi:hypothetical protein